MGDRGMLTHKRIEEDLRPHDGLEWINALRAPQIQKLAEIQHPDYPGERLMVSRNPLLAAERVCKRGGLIEAATKRQRQPVRGAERISYLVGKALAASNVEKCFRWEITPQGLHWERDAALDGIYVLPTTVPEQHLDSEQTVLAYKRLATVERAFRSLKSVDLNVRPIHHRLPDRARAHVFAAMLSYYVEWQMRQALAPVLFDDEQRGGERPSPVAPAVRSAEARAKAQKKHSADGHPVQSFQDWLKDLATTVKNRIQPLLRWLPAFEMTTRPTCAQQYALELLHVKL